MPESQQTTARRIGLGLALLARILLLLSLIWMIGLTQPIFAIGELEVSSRDVVLGAGGIFLTVKGTMDLGEAVRGRAAHAGQEA
ncbi:MAG: TerC family protein [Geminicoccaceae bacterium]